MEHTKHIARAGLLLVLAAVAFVVVRHFAIPESFGMYGHYRFDSVREHAGKALVHGAPGVCRECHQEQAEALAEGGHSSVSCEVCHAPLDTAFDEDQHAPRMKVQESLKLCGWCHQRLVARPKDFPQVVLEEHVTAGGMELIEGVCLECHDDPHNPAG